MLTKTVVLMCRYVGVKDVFHRFKEFCAAMALIAGVNEGKQLPTSMPESLIQLVWPAGFPGQAPVASVISSQPGLTSSSPGSTSLLLAQRLIILSLGHH